MRALVWHGKEKVSVDTVPDPTIVDPTDAIIRVTSTAICGSDLHLYDGYQPTMEDGDILGHEPMGVVVEVGKGVTKLKKGDRVVVPFVIACGECFFCQKGLFSACERSNPNAEVAKKAMGQSPAGLFGFSHMLGGFAGGQAEYLRVPYADVGPVKIESDLPDEQVLFLSDIFPTGWMAAENAGIEDGDTVAVWGCGPVAQMAIRSAWMLGAGRVIAIDMVPERLAMARSAGKAETIDFSKVDVYDALMELTQGRGPDRCIDAVGCEAHAGGAADAVLDKVKAVAMLATDRAHVLREAIMCCRMGGTLSIPGVYVGFADKIPVGCHGSRGHPYRMPRPSTWAMLREARRERGPQRRRREAGGGGNACLRPFGRRSGDARSALRAVHRRLLSWARPATGPRIGSTVGDLTRTKAALIAENAFLRQQLVILCRPVRRPVLTPGDRLRLVLLARLARGWRAALLITQPETLLRWHRQGFRLVWRARSRGASKRPQVSAETVRAIQRLAAENRLWGAERIRGELLKLGIRVGKRTVQRHMRTARPPRPGGRAQTWATFLRNHAPETWACDFLQVVDLRFRALFAFIIVDLGSRRVVHVGVTRHPTDAWAAQQLREATPFDLRPRYLIRDNDAKYGSAFARVAAGSRITVLRTPVRAPRANATCERFLGSVRRECLDHVLVLGEGHLRRVLREYVAYFNAARPHQGIGQAVPDAPSPVPPTRSVAPIVALPVLGGLHHDYRRAA